MLLVTAGPTRVTGGGGSFGAAECHGGGAGHRRSSGQPSRMAAAPPAAQPATPAPGPRTQALCGTSQRRDENEPSRPSDGSIEGLQDRSIFLGRVTTNGGSHHQRTSQSSHYTHGLASGGRCSGIEETKR